MTCRTLRLNSAVTPAASLYAASASPVLDEVGADQEPVLGPSSDRIRAGRARRWSRSRLPSVPPRKATSRRLPLGLQPFQVLLEVADDAVDLEALVGAGEPGAASRTALSETSTGT